MKLTSMTDEEERSTITGNSSSGRMARAPTATIEEVDENGGEDEEEDLSLTMLGGEKLRGTETPLISKSTACTLVRVSTYGSSLNQPTGGSRHDSTRSRYRTGLGGRKLRKRVVFKNGECNVFSTHISHRRLRYLQDIFTTLVDTQWRWTLLVFALSFILSWLGFATIWWLIAFTHGDFESHLEDEDWKPCVVALHNFASCFLFSIETQHTIGYGSRSTTEECPEAIFIMCLQSITGVMIQAFMVGIVFAKMARPKQRTQTLLFSRNAVICQRDGNLCLMFRVGDMRKSHIIGASIRAQLIKTCQTQEGEVLSQAQCELEVGTDYGGSDLFFIWPMTVVHRINSDSPLYRTSASELIEREKSDRFEIVVILEGTIESTGQTTQARSSYLPSEIMWGHRFEPMVTYNKDRQSYEVNYNKFNNTYNVDTPLCSAKELDDFYRIQQGLRQPVDDSHLSVMGGHPSLRRVTSEPHAMNNAVNLQSSVHESLLPI